MDLILFNVIAPIIGLILLVFGVLNFRQTPSRFIALMGLILLAVPILYVYLEKTHYNSTTQDLRGKYYLKGSRDIILKINSDNTFTLDSNPVLKKSGHGQWEIVHWDIDQLNLKFEDSVIYSFEISEANNQIALDFYPIKKSNVLFLKMPNNLNEHSP